jgi:hypothetical protein
MSGLHNNQDYYGSSSALAIYSRTLAKIKPFTFSIFDP